MPRSTSMVVALLLLLPLARMMALDPGKAISQYNHAVWGPSDGLEGFSINAVLEASDGYLWIATDEGLARFDGVRFTLYNRVTAPVMTANDISSLAEDREGSLWFGTRGGGLYRLRKDSLARFGSAEGLGGDAVLALHVDREGTLWIGVQEFGVARFVRGSFQRYAVNSDQGLNATQTFYERPDGTILFVYGSVYEHRPGTEGFRQVLFHQGFIYSLIEDGVSVVAGTSKGVIAIDTATVRTPLGARTAGMFVRALLKDRDGNLWIGTEGNGLLRRDGDQFTTFTSKEGLSSDRVLSLYEDREGNLWITTRGGGLNRLTDNRITVYGTSEHLTGDYITAIFEDHRGTWWVGTKGSGVNILRGGAVAATVTTTSGLSDSTVRSITEGPPGTFWIGTQTGLDRLVLDDRYRLTSIVQHRVLNPAHPIESSVRALYTSREGTIWIGDYGGGLYTVDGTRLKPFPPFRPPVIGDRNVHTIFQDEAGTLWVGTHAGLYGVRGDSLTRYSIEHGLSSSLVYALHEDEHHALWIGTYGGGLYRLKEGKVSAIAKSQGLFDDVIYAIVDDSLGSFWMSCNRGIFRAAKQDLNDVADGKAAMLSCEVFGLNDGLRSVECNGGSQPAAIRTRDGRLLFPTIKGLVAIDPTRPKTQSSALVARLEELRVDTSRLSLSAAHRMPPGRRTIDFHYTALGSSDPEHLRFRYRLDGFENLMVDAGSQRSARYTNLPPGTYTFTVTAQTPGGPWSSPVTSLPIIVPPLVYETWWFRLLVGLVFAGAVGMLFRYVSVRKARRRIEQLERVHALEHERARIARDMHDEIGASLTQITILSELLERNLRTPDTAEPFVRRISSTARDVVASLDEIVWFINPRHDSLESLLLYIREYIADYLDPLDIECTFTFPEDIPPSVLGADARRNIFLAVKEAVTNIAKHSGASAVTVTAGVDHGTLRIGIADNGRGLLLLPASALQDGLKNMEKRLRDIGGEMVLTGESGAGTSVTLRAPVKGLSH